LFNVLTVEKNFSEKSPLTKWKEFLSIRFSDILSQISVAEVVNPIW
jgi:hypothetical protein